MRSLAALAMALLLGACTAQQQAIIEGGIKSGQDAKDQEATILRVSLCATSIGAYHRTLDDQERAAVDILCGGDRGDALRDLNVGPPR